MPTAASPSPPEWRSGRNCSEPQPAHRRPRSSEGSSRRRRRHTRDDRASREAGAWCGEPEGWRLEDVSSRPRCRSPSRRSTRLGWVRGCRIGSTDRAGTVGLTASVCVDAVAEAHVLDQVDVGSRGQTTLSERSQHRLDVPGVDAAASHQLEHPRPVGEAAGDRAYAAQSCVVGQPPPPAAHVEPVSAPRTAARSPSPRCAALSRTGRTRRPCRSSGGTKLQPETAQTEWSCS